MQEIFFNRICELRKENGLSQYELADQLELGCRSVLSLYELGKRNINIVALKKLAFTFGVSIDYLLYEDDYRNHSDFIKETLGLSDKSIKVLQSKKCNDEINQFIQNINKSKEKK